MRSESLTPRGRRRLEQLLRAAQVVFETSGYFDTRVADIVAEAGVSHGTFYIYFESKDDVLRALIDELVDATFAASEIPVDHRLPPFDQLQASIRHFTQSYRQRAAMHRILEQVVTFDDQLLAVRQAIRSRFTARIQASIESRQRRGVCEESVDALHTAHALGGMVENFAYALYVLRQPLEEEAAIASMTQVWARAVGIPVPPAPAPAPAPPAPSAGATAEEPLDFDPDVTVMLSSSEGPAGGKRMAVQEDSLTIEGMRADVGRGALPKDRYLSADFWQAENLHLWPRVWQWACLEDDVAQPGDFYEYEIGRRSFLITRAEDGKLRAFHNVCLHRGNRLRNGAGSTRELSCRYHGWTWALDGELVRIPDEEGFHQLDTSCLGLRSVQVDTWQGFVFINPDPDAEPLTEFLGPIIDRLAPYHFGEQTCSRSLTMPIEANWKTVVDGFLEVYHIHRIHPQLLRYLDDVNTTYEVWGPHSAMYMPMGVASPRLNLEDDDLTLLELSKPGSGYHGKMLSKSAYLDKTGDKPKLTGGVTVRQALIEVGRQEADELGRDYDDLSDDQMVDDHHYFIFPNIICNIDAGHFIASRIRPDAQNPEKCYFDMHIFDWFSPEEKAARPPRVHQEVDPGTKVGRVPDQDFTQLPKVQLGMHADVLTEILLSDQECRVLAFHDHLDHFVYRD